MPFGAPKWAEVYRVHLQGYPLGDRCNGAFQFADGRSVIISNGGGWEHVSVSRKGKLPTYDDMCRTKDTFWGEEDCVMQLHPPKSEYVNHHPYTLHLWCPIGQEIPRPPSIYVGPKSEVAK